MISCESIRKTIKPCGWSSQEVYAELCQHWSWCADPGSTVPKGGWNGKWAWGTWEPVGDWSQPDCQSEEEHMWCIPSETSPEDINEKLLPLSQMGSRLLAPSLGTALFYGVQLNHCGSCSSHTSTGEMSRQDSLVLQPLALILLSSCLK